MEELTYTLSELEKTAKKVIDFAGDEKIWVFSGEMGAGKTTLIQAIGKQLGIQDTIQSPTFALVNEYLDLQHQSVYHFDFFRLDDEDEALDFGIEEYLDSNLLCWMEWAERIPNLLPSKYLKISIFAELNFRTLQMSHYEQTIEG